MNDQQKALLNDHGVLILPEIIDHDTYGLLLEATLLRPKDLIRLYCRGDGGDSRAMIAMIDLITVHGKCIGMLPGPALSSHAIIWAACTRRYVYAGGSIGVHCCAVNGLDHADGSYMLNRQKEFEMIDRTQSRVLATACRFDVGKKYGESYWYRQLKHVGSQGVARFDAKFLIKCRMADDEVEFVP